MAILSAASLGANFTGSFKEKSVDIFDYSILSFPNSQYLKISYWNVLSICKVESLLKILLNFETFMPDETPHHTE